MITVTVNFDTTSDELLAEYADAGLVPTSVTFVPDTVPALSLTFDDSAEPALREFLGDMYDDLLDS